MSAPGTRSGALISLVDAEHALGYPGDLDLTPDRAPLREFVARMMRAQPGELAGEAASSEDVIITRRPAQ